MPSFLRYVAYTLAFAAFRAANAISRPNDGSRASAVADALLARLTRDLDCVGCGAYLGATTEFAPAARNLLCRHCFDDGLPAA